MGRLDKEKFTEATGPHPHFDLHRPYELSVRPSVRGNEAMAATGRGSWGVAGRPSASGDGRMDGQDCQQADRRAKARQVKRGVQLFDVAWLLFCVGSAIVLIIA